MAVEDWVDMGYDMDEKRWRELENQVNMLERKSFYARKMVDELMDKECE